MHFSTSALVAALCTLQPTVFARPATENLHNHLHARLHPKIGVPVFHDSVAPVSHSFAALGKRDDGEDLPYLENKYQRIYKNPTNDRTKRDEDEDSLPYLENKYQRLYKNPGNDNVKRDDEAVVTVVSTVYVTVLPQPATATPVATNVVKQPANQVAASSGVPMPTMAYASKLSVPVIAGSILLGKCNYAPDMQYAVHQNEAMLDLPQNLLGSTANALLSLDYPIYNGSGTLDIPANAWMAPLDFTPTLSRDNGKGGYLNGYHIWVFADTGIYTPDGQFAGFVSSSVAVDKGMNGLSGKAITLRDMAGEWDDSTALVRGFAPFTLGEASYTNTMAGSGSRYAIWAESAIVPLTATESLLFAPVVFINEYANPMYTSTGMTLIKVTVDNPTSGPSGQRIVDKLFDDSTIEWGGVAAIRSWSASTGPGGSGGRIYTVGNTIGGLMLSRCDAANVADPSKYEFYDAATKSWGSFTSKAPRNVDMSKHVFVDGAYATVDIFYSPAHLTWLMVFETPYADNKFYWRYLTPADGKPIYPQWAAQGNKYGDFVDNIVTGTWSQPQLLFAAPPPSSGTFVYGGGVHQGYFGEEDITNGGKKMLLSWTSPTTADSTSLEAGYDQVTAVIEFA